MREQLKKGHRKRYIGDIFYSGWHNATIPHLHSAVSFSFQLWE